jgi:hypothetical protein
MVQDVSNGACQAAAWWFAMAYQIYRRHLFMPRLGLGPLTRQKFKELTREANEVGLYMVQN